MKPFDGINLIKMNLLITGGAGFIGSHLIKKLINFCENIIVLVRDKENINRLEKIKDRLIIYDLNTPLNEIFSSHKIDIVIHLATYYKKNHTNEDVKEMFQTNVIFPSLILEEMSRNNVKYFINTGTFFEYAFGNNESLSEESKKEPYNLYACTKINFKEILKYYSKKHGLKVVDLKLFSPYGSDDNEKLIVFLIKSLIRKRGVEISKGEQELNWTYIRDIVDAYVKSIEYILRMENNFESFNICSEEVVSIKEIVKILEEISGERGLINCSKDYAPDEIMYAKGDNSKAKKLLGWFSFFDIRKGLKETFEFYNKNGI